MHVRPQILINLWYILVYVSIIFSEIYECTTPKRKKRYKPKWGRKNTIAFAHQYIIISTTSLCIPYFHIFLWLLIIPIVRLNASHSNWLIFYGWFALYIICMSISIHDKCPYIPTIIIPRIYLWIKEICFPFVCVLLGEWEEKKAYFYYV